MARTTANNCPFLSSSSDKAYWWWTMLPVNLYIQRHGDKLFHSVVQKMHKGYGTYTIENAWCISSRKLFSLT
jgi:hypothetical protein